MEDQGKKPLKEKIKEGVSVKEIETLARKYTVETFMILALIIASISSIFDFFTGPWWSIALLGITSILSIAFPKQIIAFEEKMFKFLSKQEKASQIAIGIVRIVIALFIPFIIFAEMGLLAGCSFHYFSQHPPTKEIKKDTTDDKNI